MRHLGVLLVLHSPIKKNVNMRKFVKQPKDLTQFLTQVNCASHLLKVCNFSPRKWHVSSIIHGLLILCYHIIVI